MAEHFIRVKDATRLRKGDLMVIPSEAGQKKKRLHVSPDTYGKMGLSIGFTCRASNSEKGVDSLLCRDDGRARVLVATCVTEAYGIGSLGDNRVLRFIGNSVTERPDSPMINWAKMQELPLWPDPGTADDLAWRRVLCKMFVRGMPEAAQAALEGKLTDRMFIRELAWNNDVCEAVLTEAYDSCYAREPRQCRNLSWVMPTSRDATSGHVLAGQEITDFLANGEIFSPMVGNLQVKDLTLHCPRKFLAAMQARGAEFYRPDGAFLARVAASAVRVMLEEFSSKCTTVAADCRRYAAHLAEGIERMDERVAKTDRIVRDLGLKKPFEKLDKAFKKEVVK